MTITEYINKLHEWAKDIGPEDEVKVSPIRLIFVLNLDLATSLIDILFQGKLSDNN